MGVKYKLLLALMCFFTVSCANNLRVTSFPSDAKVYVKDIITGDKKEIGKTPLVIARTPEMGEVFFVSLEKDDFLVRDVLVKSSETESVLINAKLEPKEEKRLADELGLSSPPATPDQKDMKKKKEEEAAMLKQMKEKMDQLEYTISMYKDALFSQRYIGESRFTSKDNDKIVKLLFMAQKDIINRKYKNALDRINQAITIDEYMAQAHILKGSVYFIMKNYRQARVAWERAMEVDPYNEEVLNYLKGLYRRIGISPSRAINTALSLRESMKETRAPASR